MQIVATFNSYEEMQDFARKILSEAPADPNKTTYIAEEIINRAEAKEAAEKAAKKAEAKKSSPKEEKPVEEPKEEKTEAPAAAPSVGESELKVVLGKALKAGKKDKVMALWEEYDVKNLTELIKKHPDKLDEVYAKAEAL